MSELLSKLLGAWRTAPHPRVADAVDGLTEQLLAATPRAALPGTKRKADLDAWKKLEKANDPLDFPRLIAAARGGQQEDVLRQVKALARWKHPRFGRGVVELLENPPYAGIKSRPLLTYLLDALTSTGDLRVAQHARELAARYLSIVSSSTGGFVVEGLQKVAATLEKKAEPALSAAVLRACEEAEKQAPPKPRAAVTDGLQARVQALLALVYEAPDDDRPRRVLADALLEAGDARGEFVRRQLAGEPVDDLREQPAVAAWLQPLQMAGACTFTRGFVDSVAVYKTAAKTAHLPEWNTVRGISELGKLTLKDTRALLDSPQLRAVREVSGLLGKQIATLTPDARPWTSLSISELEDEAAEALTRFPALRHLRATVRGDLPAKFLAPSPRLETLTLVVRGTVPADALLPLKNLARLSLRADKSSGLQLPATLEELSLTGPFERPQWGDAPRLRKLSCAASALVKSGPLPSVNELEVDANIASLADLERLEHLHLVEADKTRPLASDVLTPLKRLTSLRLDYGVRLTAKHLEGLDNLVHLSGLWNDAVELPRLPSLISFECMAPRSLAPLKVTLKNNPQLEYLHLAWNSESPLYFYDAAEFDRKSRAGWELLRELVEPSGVRVLRFHQVISLMRQASGEWSVLEHVRRPTDRDEVKRMLEGPRSVFQNASRTHLL